MPPPHNAGSISRHIARRERIVDYDPITLFSTISSPTPMSDQDTLNILTGTGPGSTPQDPVALLIPDRAGADRFRGNMGSPGATAPLGPRINSSPIKDGLYLIRCVRGSFWSAASDTLSHVKCDAWHVAADARKHLQCQAGLSFPYQDSF